MIQQVRTVGYNYNFDPVTGKFARWGVTEEDNPQYSPLGPELVDCEISTICSGINGVPCSHCYKSNTSKGKNMSLETFKKVFEKLPKNVNQIAFGVGSIDSNPDMLKIFKYCRENGVIPNVTVNGWGLDTWWAEELAGVCGAVAVSRYDNKDICYNAIDKLLKAGLKQVNIHQLVAEETYHNCVETIEDRITNPRLEGLNAIVFLSLKKKGRGEGYNSLGQVEFDNLVKMCFDNWISFGFDSCSAQKFLGFLKRYPKYNISKSQIEDMIEPCESTLFSIYINVDGEVNPCSFCEGEWWGSNRIPVSILDCDDFLQDIWMGKYIKGFRKKLLFRCRECPMYIV